MATLTTLALVGALPLLIIAAVTALTAVSIAVWWRRESAWARRADAESHAVLDRIARGEERTYTLADVREMLRREGEGQ